MWRCGYRGYWSLDYLVDAARRFFILELNLRRFAEAAAYDLARQSRLCRDGRFLLSCSQAKLRGLLTVRQWFRRLPHWNHLLVQLGGDALPFNLGGTCGTARLVRLRYHGGWNASLSSRSNEQLDVP
jgi:hypothetical protein